LQKNQLNRTVESNGQISHSLEGHSAKRPDHSVVLYEDLLDTVTDNSTDRVEADAELDILHLEALIACLQEDFGDIKYRTYELFRQNKTSYDLLWCLFPICSEIIFNDPSSGVNCAGRVRTFRVL
jgi:hypothetical protein